MDPQKLKTEQQVSIQTFDGSSLDKTQDLSNQFANAYTGVEVMKSQDLSEGDTLKLQQIERRINQLAANALMDRIPMTRSVVPVQCMQNTPIMTSQLQTQPIVNKKNQNAHVDVNVDANVDGSLNINVKVKVNVEDELKKLQQQLEELRKKYVELDQKNQYLQARISKLECSIVTKEELNKLKADYQQKFTLFNGKFRVLEENDQKVMIYIDESFKSMIKPSQKFVQKMEELQQKNKRLYVYGNKLYWSLMNQILSYRALSTGMVSKGYIQGKYKQIGEILEKCSELLGGIPIVGNILKIVTDLSSLFFAKQDQIAIHNISSRVEGYLTQNQISQDVANAILLLLQNPSVQHRVVEYKQASDPNALIDFLNLIYDIKKSPRSVVQMFIDKMMGLRKEKSDHDCITENVLTDSSLIIWLLVKNDPKDLRKPITCAAQALLADLRENQKSNANQPENNLQNNENQKTRPKYIKVKVIGASIDINTEFIGKMYPFCIVKYNNVSFTTQVVHQGHQSPQWNKQFVIQASKNPMLIQFQVYDKERLKKDDLIGYASISDTNLEHKDKYLPLHIKQQKTGKLKVRISQ